MSKLKASEMRELRVFDLERDDPAPERWRAFVVERDGFLFSCKRLFSIREMAKAVGFDRDTVTRWVEEMEPIEGPGGAKLYSFTTFIEGYADHERKKRR